MSSLMDDLFGNQRQQKQDLKHDYKEINDQSRMSRHVSKKKQLPKNNVIQKEDDTLHVPYLTNEANNSSLKSKPFYVLLKRLKLKIYLETTMLKKKIILILQPSLKQLTTNHKIIKSQKKWDELNG